jgi:hypothetical protein
MICRTAVELICRSADAPLSAGERFGLGVHTLFCGPCRRFRSQIQRLDAACGAVVWEDPPGGGTPGTGGEGTPGTGGEGLSKVARERIVAALRDS